MKSLFVRQSPVQQSPLDETTYTIAVESDDGSTVTLTDGGNLDMEMYANGSGDDIVATYTSGSLSVSGDTLTSKVVKDLKGGNKYVCVFTATVNGSKKMCGKLQINCQSDKELQQQ